MTSSNVRSWGQHRVQPVGNSWTTRRCQQHPVEFQACRVKTVDNQWIQKLRTHTAESRFSTIHRAYYYNYQQLSQQHDGSGDNPTDTTVGRLPTDPENPDAISM